MSGTLNHSQAEIIRQLLIDLGLGSSASAWPVYYSNEPDTPDNCITVYNKVGSVQGRTHDNGETQEHHGVQVRVRSITHSVGYLKARRIAEAFDTQVRLEVVTVDTDEYLVHAITRNSDVFSIGFESPTSRRRLFTVNAVVSIRLLSTLGS